MQRICAASVFGCRVVHQHVWDVANEAQSANLTANGPLEFCFDFIRCDDGPEKLLFVQDAARPPLAELEDEDFLRRVQLVQDLEFPSACHKLKYSPDGRFILAAGTHNPQVYRVVVSSLTKMTIEGTRSGTNRSGSASNRLARRPRRSRPRHRVWTTLVLTRGMPSTLGATWTKSGICLPAESTSMG